MSKCLCAYYFRRARSNAMPAMTSITQNATMVAGVSKLELPYLLNVRRDLAMQNQRTKS